MVNVLRYHIFKYWLLFGILLLTCCFLLGLDPLLFVLLAHLHFHHFVKHWKIYHKIFTNARQHHFKHKRTNLNFVFRVRAPLLNDLKCLFYQICRFKLSVFVHIHFLQQFRCQARMIIHSEQKFLNLLFVNKVQLLGLWVTSRGQESTVILNWLKYLNSVDH